jgi:hypothetical protein
MAATCGSRMSQYRDQPSPGSRCVAFKEIPIMSNTITVWSGGHLMWAARAAKAGDTILLAPGNYGDVTLSHINAKGTITIRSANLDNEAVFRTLAFTNAHGIVIENIDVVRPLNPGERHNSTAMQVNRSSNITFSGLELHGSLDGNAIGDGHGMSVSGSNRISILNSTFQQLNATVIVANSNDFLFAGNTVKNVQEGISISSVNRGVFEQNYMADWQANHAAGAHPDMFQVHSGGKAVASTNVANLNKGRRSFSKGVRIFKSHLLKRVYIAMGKAGGKEIVLLCVLNRN